MADIHWDVISSEVRSALQSGKVKRDYAAKKEEVMKEKANVVTSKFIQVLRDAVDNSNLSANARDAVNDFDSTNPEMASDDSFIVGVYFDGDMSRPSLNTERYPEGIDDIAALLDKGVDHKMHVVRGEWHGKEIYSRTVIKGENFIQDAIDDFNGNFAAEYDVRDISVNQI